MIHNRMMALFLSLLLFGAPISNTLSKETGLLYRNDTTTLESPFPDPNDTITPGITPSPSVPVSGETQGMDYTPEPDITIAPTPYVEEDTPADSALPVNPGEPEETPPLVENIESDIPYEEPTLPVESLPPPSFVQGNVDVGEYIEISVLAGTSFSLKIPIVYSNAEYRASSNASVTGELLPYFEGNNPADYDQTITAEVSEAYFTFSPQGAGGLPFVLDSANTSAVISNGENFGYAVFEGIRVLENTMPGSYRLPLDLTWSDAIGETYTLSVAIIADVISPAGSLSLGAYEAPVASAGGTATLAIPVNYKLGDRVYESNLSADGSISSYTTGITSYDQAIASALSEITVIIPADQGENSPLDDSAEVLSQSVVVDGENSGYAYFEDIPIQSDAEPGTYAIDVALSWTDLQGVAAMEIVPASIIISEPGLPYGDGVVVFTFAELKTVITTTAYDTIYLGFSDSTTPLEGETRNDGVIPFTAAGGIAVSRNITIVGTDPRNGRRVRLVDWDTEAAGDTIYTAVAGLTITLAHVDVTGYNFYGILHNPAAYAPATFNFIDVTYIGRQITCMYGNNAVAIFTDCDITLQNMSGRTSQEVAEAAEVRLYGDNTFVRTSGTAVYSMFWLNYSPYRMNIASEASVIVDTSYYFIYRDANDTAILSINGSLDVTTRNSGGMMYADQYFSTVAIGAEGSLKLRHNETAFDSLRTTNLNVLGSLDIVKSGSDRVCIYLFSSATFSQPRRINLQNPNGRLWGPYSASAPTITIQTQAINMWSLGGAKYIWNNNDLSSFSFTARRSAIATTSITLLENLTDNKGAALSSVELSGTTFNAGNASRLLFGQQALSIDAESVTRGSQLVTGTYEGGSSSVEIREYNPITTLVLQQNAFAALTGTGYQATLPSPILSSVDSRIYALGILNELEAHVFFDSEAIFALYTVPDVDFGTIQVGSTSQLIERATPLAFRIAVQDTRDYGGWTVKAKATSVLTQDGGTDTLPDALVFINDGVEMVLSEEAVVYTKVPIAYPQPMEEITWNVGAGLLLRLQPGDGIPGSVYSATLTWTLEQTP